MFNGIFGTRKGKSYRQGRKAIKFGANGFEVVEFKRNQNPKLRPPIPIWGLDARVEVKQYYCLDWDLASRLKMKLEIPPCGGRGVGWQEFYDFENCLKTNFGTSVNALPNFSTKMGGKNQS
ncbi:hypothetical protein AVEN_17677-1 [Araneus ventricosus]|uniref:Uncharacterized protein n=1 Tax=Araneus ventricosus TaxID=182803 RepID=A0A4Y2JEN0_ARAVE|nr:hypothetical protein AVEN_17677-1 [Araneus ventricosus]